MLDTLFQFVTMVIPKSGIVVGALSLTLNLVLFAVIVIRDPNQTVRSLQLLRWIGICYVPLLAFGMVTFTLGMISSGVEPLKLAQVIIVVASPLAIVATTRRLPEVDHAERRNSLPKPGARAIRATQRAFQLVAVALLIVNAYGLLQYFMGVSNVTVEGLTTTYGQAIEQKTIGYSSSGDTAKKIPSTFQSGTYFGIFCVLGMGLMLIWRPMLSRSARWKVIRVAAIIAALVGLLLCGARAVLLPFAVAGIAILLGRIRVWPSRTLRRNFVALLIGGGLLVLYLLVFQQEIISSFVSRNIVETLNDSTASGRTGQWSGLWSRFRDLSLSDMIIVLLLGNGSHYNLGSEGLPALLVQMGLPATLAFLGLFAAPIVHFFRRPVTRPMAWCLGVVLATFCVDLAFDYPPNIMLVFMAVGLALAGQRCGLLMESVSHRAVVALGATD
ncbi:O-antigen ligase family protein [Bifidobacterium choloepi]|uniref:O-antigen ligase family protein n=1 Tax=Bifidobacterium choloepi TaxID=2614131 RepID=A0A6I5N0D8_9BIFI|nr:hypothetical protein [Bifidobacterium choloepi]NEG70368.1 hypothetical protein [Bifidobacterium choloepi]